MTYQGPTNFQRLSPDYFSSEPVRPDLARYQYPAPYQDTALYQDTAPYQDTAGYQDPAGYEDPAGWAGYQDPGGWPEPAGYADPNAGFPDPSAYQGLPAPSAAAPARRRSRGVLAGAVTGFLAGGTAIGVAVLAAAFVRPQASPVIAVGEAAIDRTPSAVKQFAIQYFGQNDKNVLLLGMYVAIALLAITIGLVARKRLAAGVIAMAAFGGFGAFVAITRPENRISDAIPSLIGGAAGIAALVLLVWAAAPAAVRRGRRASHAGRGGAWG
jgi:hypothetical protein